MSTHRESQIIRAPRERIFDLVADVERYPEFLPLWLDARVYRHRDETTYFTEQEIGLGFLRERFRTKTVMTRPTSIEVSSHDGLFRDFRIFWTFADAGTGDIDGVGNEDGDEDGDREENACRVEIALTWEVCSPLMQGAIDLILPETARSMVRAFDRRARRTGAG